jgi:microcystin-dependent protein
MSFTNHFNLETVAQGVDNWDAPMNENFDLIDKGPTIKATAGLTISAYKVVYRDVDNTLKLAIAGVTNDPSSRFIGFTRNDFNLGEDGFAQYDGWISDPDWNLSTSAPYYLSTTVAGEITSTKPTADSVLVAFAIGTNELLIKPWVEASGTGSGSSAPVGSIMPYAGTAAPGNWLMCAGQTVSRSTYVDLFNVVSTTFGIGDGSTTFNVPDMRGRVTVGLDNMDGVVAGRVTNAAGLTLGDSSGFETHTLIEAEMPAHTHTYGVTTNTYQSFPSASPQALRFAGSSVTNSTGGDGAHSNMQPYISLNYIIKY